MLDKKQFRELIIRPTLKGITLWSQAAENLVLGTALVESNLTYLKQINGNALSLYQIQAATYKDICNRINTHVVLYIRCLKFLNMQYFPFDESNLIGNITLATIICRLKYFLIPTNLPDANDYHGLALYHKKYYNTHLGATDISKSELIFKSVVDEGQSI